MTHRTFDLPVNGAWHPGAHRHTLHSPFDQTPIGEVGVADAALVEQALAFAHRRSTDVARVPLHRRAEVLQKVADAIKARAEEFAELIRDEAGKPIQYARAEAQRGVETFLCAAAEARRMDGEALPLDTLPRGEGRFGIVKRFPVGPIAAISPFNFPLNLVAHKVAPAIAAGCPVILKPASQTPMTALLLARVCMEAGLVDGGLQVVPCNRRDADALVTDERVRLLTFTGSPAVGWDMKARAGRKKVVLELGGNAAAVVMPDVDPVTVMGPLAAGAYAYAGQVCISVQRILVAQEVLPRFLDAFTAHVRSKVPSGDPRDGAVVNGPMIDDGNARRMNDWLEEGKRMGARVLCGGEREGNVVKPAVLTGADPASRIYADEAFGPVVHVEGYSNVDDALRRINSGRFGLQAGVFTRDVKLLWRCFDELEVGGVIHDDVPTFRVDQAPYGGVKDSGLGREGVRYALEDMTERRLLVLRTS